MASDGDLAAGRHAIAVVTNKSWYEGYVPLFVYFAQRACPRAHVLVFVMGPVAPETRRALDRAGCDPECYSLVADYGLDYGKSPLAAKMSRWTVPLHPRARLFDTLYIGDIDILLAREWPDDLVAQHLANCGRLGIPVSNMVRLSGDRLSGLHFVRMADYLERMQPHLQALHEFLVATGDDVTVLKDRYPEEGGDENALYDAVEAADPSWIAALARAEFRPYHGVHLGMFRTSGRLGKVALATLRSGNADLRRYWREVSPELARTIRTGHWDEAFSAFPRVETACRNFLAFFLDWRAGLYRAYEGEERVVGGLEA